MGIQIGGGRGVDIGAIRKSSMWDVRFKLNVLNFELETVIDNVVVVPFVSPSKNVARAQNIENKSMIM